MGVKLFLYMGGCDNDDDNDDNGGHSNKVGCDKRLAAIMVMVMMITMVAGMVSACCVLRALRGSKSDPSKCLTCACILVGYRWVQENQFVITIFSLEQGLPCKEISWLHDKPTCSVFLSMLFYAFPLSPFSSSSFCRLRAYLIVVTRSVFLIMLLPLSRKLLENAPPRKILQGRSCFSALNIIQGSDQPGFGFLC